MRVIYNHVDCNEDELILEGNRIRQVAPFTRSASIISIIMDWLRVCPDLFVYVVVNVDWAKEVHPPYMDANVPRLAWVPFKRPRVIGSADSFFCDDVFKQFIKFPIDAVIGNSIPSSATRAAREIGNMVCKTPAIVRHETVYLNSGSGIGLWGQDTTTVFSESVHAAHLFFQKQQRDLFYKLYITDNASPSLVDAMMLHTNVIKNGVILDEMKQFDGEKIPGSVGVFGRPTAGKQVPETLELYRKMKISGKVNKVHVTWNRPDTIESIIKESIPDVDFTPNCSRKLFLQKAGQTGCAIWASKSEAGAFSVIEASATGCVPIVIAKPWSSEYNWPLRFSSWGEAAKMILLVHKNQALWSQKAVEFASSFDAHKLWVQHFDWIKDIGRTSSLFQSKSDEQRSELLAKSKYFAALKTHNGKSISWNEIKKMQLPTDTMGTPIIFGYRDIPVLLSSLGYKDTLSSVSPTYEKV